jgi:hypothetical protein
MPRIEKGVMFSERCSAFSVQLIRGASAGTLISVETKLVPPTSLIGFAT